MKKGDDTQKSIGTLTEKQIRNQIQSYLRWAGWFVYYNFGGPYSYSGLSDLVAVRDGQVVFVEIKSKSGKQSDEQRKFQHDLEAAGGRYVLARDLCDVLHLGNEGATGQMRMY